MLTPTAQDDNHVDSTHSITSSIMQYRIENGRTYHAYKDHRWSPFSPGSHKDISWADTCS